MDKREFGLIASALRTYYPRYNMLPNAEAIDLWYQELKDLPYEVAASALRKWTNQEKWPPSIAEIRAYAGEMTSGQAPDWGEGWQEVQRAIRRYGWAREKEALASISPSARTAAERIGWMDICTSENAETLRAQFRQVFQVIVEREKRDALIAPEVKTLIAGIAQRPLSGAEAPALPDAGRAREGGAS